jgi:hypothetical protein
VIGGEGDERFYGMWFAMGETSPVEGNGCANPPKNVFSGEHPGIDPRAAQPIAPLAGWEIDARFSRFSFFFVASGPLLEPTRAETPVEDRSG